MSPVATEPLLSLRDVEVTFTTEAGPTVAARGVSFDVLPGETVAIVGESGSGKSTTAAAVIGLLAQNGRVTGGTIRFDGQDLTTQGGAATARLRGSDIGLVPQDPMSNLNPVMRVGAQIVEALEDNGVAKGQAARTRAVELLEEAGLPDAARRAQQYPHEFSGGMRQRALIAMGLACRPRLLIADEPTSALDVTVQRTILDRLDELTDELGTAVLLITHDLGLAAERADRIVVMYRGEVVETGPALELLRSPQHEYTKRLLAAAPSLASRRIQLAKQHGADDEAADDLVAMTAGHDAGPSPATSTGATVAETTVAGAPGTAAAVGGPAPALDHIVEVEHVSKVFSLRGKGLFSRGTDFTAVDDVSFTIPRGTTVAIVGESGSGKSTVARMMLDLLEPTSGEIRFNGRPVGGRTGARRSSSAARCSRSSRTRTPRSTRSTRSTGRSRSRSRPTAPGRRRSGGDASTSSWTTSRCRWGCCAGTPPSSPAASGSASRSPGRSRWTRTSWCATRRCRRSTSSCSRRSCTCSPTCSTAVA